ncbi:MAG: hypothetical protein KAS54_09140, partial [Dehalococcoidia bacterium]|nr:hypothetical protein [Dehalococcoidia bacterium]
MIALLLPLLDICIEEMPVTLRRTVLERRVFIKKLHVGEGPVSRRIIYQGEGSPEGKKSPSRNARLQRAEPSLGKRMAIFKVPFFKIFPEFPGGAAEIFASRSGETVFNQIIKNSLNCFVVLLAHQKTSFWFSSVLPSERFQSEHYPQD